MTSFKQQISLCLGLLASFSLISAAYGQKQNAPAGKPSLDVSKKVKFKEKTEVNFDDTNIDGNVKSPFGNLTQSRDQDFNKSFIKLRTNWHDQMVTSVSGISQ